MKLRYWARMLDPSLDAQRAMQYKASCSTNRELHAAWVALDKKNEIIASLQHSLSAIISEHAEAARIKKADAAMVTRIIEETLERVRWARAVRDRLEAQS